MSVEWPEEDGSIQRIMARRDAFVAARDLYVGVLLDKFSRESPFAAGGGDAYRRERSIFVQYMNPEVLSCYGRDIAGGQAERILSQAVSATRVAVLLTDRYLIFPASSIFEVPWFHIFLERVEPLIHEDVVRYTSPTPELAAYRDIKAREYRRDEDNPYLNRPPRLLAHPDLVWHPRRGRSTAADITDLWQAALTPGNDLHPLVKTATRIWGRSHRRVEALLAKVPDRLEGQAFIKRFVLDTLPAGLPDREDTLLALFLSRAYLHSYLLDLDAAILTDLPLGDLSCGLGQAVSGMDGRILSFRRMNIALQWLNIHEFVHSTASWKELVMLRSSPELSMITSLVHGSNFQMALAAAVMTASRSTHFKPAVSYADALSNLSMVGDGLMDILR